MSLTLSHFCILILLIVIFKHGESSVLRTPPQIQIPQPPLPPTPTFPTQTKPTVDYQKTQSPKILENYDYDQLQLGQPEPEALGQTISTSVFWYKEDVIREYLDKGFKISCLVNVGQVEQESPDFPSFPPDVLGNRVNGQSRVLIDEKGETLELAPFSLNLRRVDVLLPIMRRRFEVASKNGCTTINARMPHGYDFLTGFNLTTSDQKNYCKEINAQIKALGLGMESWFDSCTHF